jgi:hypothetical protein
MSDEKDNRRRRSAKGGCGKTGRPWEIDVEVGGARAGDKVGKTQVKLTGDGSKKKEKAKSGAGVNGQISCRLLLIVQDAARLTLTSGKLGRCFGKDDGPQAG